MNESRIAKQEIKSLKEIISNNSLKIPPYQRPYKWDEKHVTQLLDDIYEHIIIQEKTYRIGSVILHEVNKNELNIVDGQQRLTTISILLKALDKEDCLLLNQKYKHKISKENIVYNYRVINNWKQKISKENIEFFYNKLIENCEFVLFTVFNQDEAFQLFDSQNARGKELEPYDLLKAFHLREMKYNTEEEKSNCVKKWEESIENHTLKPIFDNHLFKIRKWAKNESIYNFTKKDIDEFKGISLYEKQQFPYEESLRTLDGVITNAQNDYYLKNHKMSQTYPFSITMPIINGKRFFEYIEHYIELKNNLIPLEQKMEVSAFNKFYKKYCLYYQSYRAGDQKVRNLYENILLQFIDRFGFVSDFENYYIAFYKEVFFIRCNSKSIRLETILNSPSRKIIQEINNSLDPNQLRNYIFKPIKIKEDLDLVNNIEFIKEAINTNNFRENESK